MPYEIEFTASAREHLRAMTARNRGLILEAIDAQLTRQPAMPTRNRKPMRPNRLAAWELRIGQLRAYYRIIEEPDQMVQVVAIGEKRREQIWVGGERIDL